MEASDLCNNQKKLAFKNAVELTFFAESGKRLQLNLFKIFS